MEKVSKPELQTIWFPLLRRQSEEPRLVAPIIRKDVAAA
jgi:hypothetical protein